MNRSEILKQAKKANAAALKAIKARQDYRVQSGYTQWDELASVTAAGTGLYLALRSGQVAMNSVNQIAKTHSWQAALWAGQKAPIYIIDPNLLEAFQNSEVSGKKELLVDLEFALPTFMLLLPKGKIKTPDGSGVDYAFVHGYDDRYPQNSEGLIMGCPVLKMNSTTPKNVWFSFMDRGGFTWSSAFGLNDGEIECNPSHPDLMKTEDIDKQFLNSLRSIVLQTLLTLQYRQDLLEPLPDDAPGTPHKKRDGKKVLVPRILGKQYRISRDLGGTHSSAQSHWRSGHWRRVCVGEGRQGRKWHWFEPVFVNGHKLEDAAA